AKPSEEGRLRREASPDAMPFQEARQPSKPAEPLERDHVEGLPLEALHHLPAPPLTGKGGPLGLGDDGARPQDGVAVAEERVAVGHAIVRATRDPEHRLAAPDVLEREGEPLELDHVTAFDEL